MNEEGCSSERCLKWGGGGSLRDLSKNILKGKVVRRREGVFKVSPPLPPWENFNHTLSALINLIWPELIFQAGSWCTVVAERPE